MASAITLDINTSQISSIDSAQRVLLSLTKGTSKTVYIIFFILKGHFCPPCPSQKKARGAAAPPAPPVPASLPIPNGTRILNVDVSTVEQLLAKQKKTSTGPDGLPYWIWKHFSTILAPTITKIFNMSLKHKFVPLLWKLDNINPIPKETPIT